MPYQLWHMPNGIFFSTFPLSTVVENYMIFEIWAHMGKYGHKYGPWWI